MPGWKALKYDVPKDSLIFLPAGRAHWFRINGSGDPHDQPDGYGKPEFPASHLNRKFFEYIGRPPKP